jgi:hypothetical protein
MTVFCQIFFHNYCDIISKLYILISKLKKPHSEFSDKSLAQQRL